MAANDNLPGYDSWKLHNPGDDTWGGDTWGGDDPECSCGRTRKSRRDCPVHGVDPDQAYDEWRDRQMEKDQ